MDGQGEPEEDTAEEIPLDADGTEATDATASLSADPVHPSRLWPELHVHRYGGWSQLRMHTGNEFPRWKLSGHQ